MQIDRPQRASPRPSRCAPGRLCALAAAALGAAVAAGQAAAQHTEPPLPAEIEQLLDTNPLPPVIVAPGGRHALLVRERQLVARDRLAEPAVRLAGRKIDPRKAAAHAPLEYFGLALVDLDTGSETALDVPRDAIVGYPSFAPDGSRFAFTLTRAAGTELWIGDLAEKRVRPLTHSLNAALGLPCTWSPDSKRLLCRRAPDARPRARPIDLDDLVQRAAQSPALGQPVLLDAARTRELLEAQLELIDSETGGRHLIGRPAAIEAQSPSPAGAFVLVRRLLEPYPRITDVDTVARVTEVWDRFGNVVATLPATARAIDWHAGLTATLTWVERRDGADRIMSLPAPFSAPAVERFALPHAFSGLRFVGDSGAGLVSDYDAPSGRTDLWLVDFVEATSDARLVARYAGSSRFPVMGINAHGKDALAVHDEGFYLRGETRDEESARPFVEHVSFADGERRRVWQAREDGYETLVDLLTPDARLLLTRYETLETPPNYFVTSSAGERVVALTHLEHPAPTLADASAVRLGYTRNDGVALSATLHLPPGTATRSDLPLVVWAYPRNVSPGGATSDLGTEARFPTFERAFRLFFLLQGYAVLDDVAMPIVGAERDANDTFIEQIVANAEAAIRAARGTGYIDANRVGVAGHSYGAFMVGNLLAHSKLFRAGVALSGAYNRTLTPFGFQTERRTLWQAPQTYLSMSPLLYSHQIEAPLLLVHGLDDDNAGTSPLQSTQFHAAIRGNGGTAELLLLPWEGHTYRARESVLSTAAHMLSWFDRYLKSDALVAQKEAGASVRPSL